MTAQTDQEWRVVPPEAPPHACALPKAADFAVGTVVECRHDIRRPEPPVSQRAKGYKTPPAIPCGIHWRVGRTWFWRDHVWRRASPGHGLGWI